MKAKALKIILALQLISALTAFVFGFFAGKVNATKEGMPLALFFLDFLMGNFFENWLNIFVRNYALSFVLYVINCVTFGVFGIFNLLTIFFVIGFSCFYSTGLFYYLFILFEASGFLYSTFSSTNLKFEMNQKGLKSCRGNMSRDLLSIIFILSIASFLEVLAMKN